MTLWYLANENSFQEISDKFCVAGAMVTVDNDILFIATGTSMNFYYMTLYVIVRYS